MNPLRLARWCAPCLSCLAGTGAWAGAGTDVPVDDEAVGSIVITATRAPASSLDLPVSIDTVSQSSIQSGQLQENLSESLAQVPGASVQNRQNYAQDLQLSVRGFGARSSFGVRGVRIYADGIPGTMPDGQGQFSQLDLGSAQRIEVLRGPFSALYGNSSGGVITLFTEDGAPGWQARASALWGPFDTQRYALKGSGGTADSSYVVDVAHFSTQGYRLHSAAERNHLNAKVRLELGAGGKLTLIANAVATPFVADPLGLTTAQWAADPRQAGTNALLYNTRKNLSQEQVGLLYEQQLGARVQLAALLYAGHRATTQYQAILQSNELQIATNPGGIIDLGRRFGGSDVHASTQWSLGPSTLKLTAGLSLDDLREARRGYLNFIGSTLGVMGALRRDLDNRAYDVDEYLQSEWHSADHWRLLLGVRHSEVRIDSRDQLAAAGTNPASAVAFTATNPVGGIDYRLNSSASLYASFGRGFETPTLNDLAYRSVNGNPPGLNTALQAARSDNYEAGFKYSRPRLALGLAGFYIDTREELAVLQNSGGRSVYQNIPQTRRRGAEAEASAPLGSSFSGRLAYTWLQAQVAQSYRTCISVPCPLQPRQIVAVGSRLPAVPENTLYAALSWHAPRWGLTSTLEAVGRAQIYANDLDTQAAPGFWVENLKIGLVQAHAAWQLNEFIRVDNLLDRRYVDSVIVNESNGRYFEPQPGRTWYLMLSASRT